MKRNSEGAPSHLFSIRLWIEHLDEDHVEIRGRVRHVLSQETTTFRKWADLVAFLTAKVSDGEERPTSGGDGC